MTPQGRYNYYTQFTDEKTKSLGVSTFSTKMLLVVEEKEHISSAPGGASQIYLLPKLNVLEVLIFYVDLVFTLCSISVSFHIKMMFLVIYQ